MSGKYIEDPRLPETHYRKARDNSEKAQKLRKNALAYYHRNKEQILERNRKYKQTPEQRQRTKERQRTYLELNRERIRALDRDLDTGKYKWDRDYRSPEQNRRTRLKTVYKMTEADFDALYQSQEGKCAICQMNITRHNGLRERSSEKAHIDHCHTMGKIRGLLCQQCNQLIGNATENIEILEKAIAYLRGHQS